MIYQTKPFFEKDTIKNVKRYLDSGKWITEHKETQRFEKKFSKFIKSKECIAFPNGTLTMSSILDCLDIKRGDEVLVSNYTMIATANAPKLVGGKTVLVDITNENLCMCPQDLKKKITSRSKFCIFTSINGRMGNIDEIEKICKKNNILLIEDAAHSIGSFFSNKHAGNFGVAGSFSFSMPKLITMGQGGAVVTNNSKLAKKLRYYKDFGRNKPGNDIHNYFGYNLKITDLQSVLALGQLKNINYRIKSKRKIYKLYFNLLKNNKKIKIFPPNENETNWSVDIYLDKSMNLHKKLKTKKIITRFVYPPINSQRIYINQKGLPVSNKFCKNGLWLPTSIDLTEREIKKICRVINNHVK
ncbi:DegT/DnrJ/EryC1/StrS family aminotransferase [Candidatus Pelagibacter sp.]|uniref:DegT/DnrJ/EryC1/StrS family aminotransferase n=1 Tax=Candidatus Pelagibacter sp. TaxID=2024849 RepID=UPI003F8755B0